MTSGASPPASFFWIAFSILAKSSLFFLSSSLAASRPWANLCALEEEPGALFVDDAHFDGEIEERAFFRDAFVVHDVELGFAERRRDLVLHDLDPGAVAEDGAGRFLDRGDAANVDADRGIKLERLAARRGFGVAEP